MKCINFQLLEVAPFREKLCFNTPPLRKCIIFDGTHWSHILHLKIYLCANRKSSKPKKSDEPLLRKRVSKKFQKRPYLMKICHFWKVNHAHSGGSYYILMKYLGSKCLPPHHRCIAHKKKSSQVSQK